MSVSFNKPSHMTWIIVHKFNANEEKQKCDWNWVTGTLHLRKQGGNDNLCLIQVKYFTSLLPYSNLMYLCIRTTLFSHLSNGTWHSSLKNTKRDLKCTHTEQWTSVVSYLAHFVLGSKLFAKNSRPTNRMSLSETVHAGRNMPVNCVSTMLWLIAAW